MSRRIRKTPLAWLNLTHDMKRLAASLAGVGFAVVLIFTELGFLNAMLRATVAPLEKLQRSEPGGTLLVVNRDKETLADTRRFAAKWLVKAEAVPGVLWARAVYLEAASSDFHNPKTDRSRKIRVLSSDSEAALGSRSWRRGRDAASALGNGLVRRAVADRLRVDELPWDDRAGIGQGSLGRP